MVYINQQFGVKADEKELKKTVRKAFKVLGIKEKDMEISIAIVDDSSIKKLNREYREKNQATDVLSFAYGKDVRLRPLGLRRDEGGEIVISYNKAKEQAKEYKHKIIDELKVLLVHGILHIAGYNHEKPADKKKMLALECKILGEGLCDRN